MDKKADETITTAAIELFTVADIKDGGYERHYRRNVQVDAENPHEKSKAASIYSMNKMEYTEPFYKCPKCEGPNLFRALHEAYYECGDCDHVGELKTLEASR